MSLHNILTYSDHLNQCCELKSQWNRNNSLFTLCKLCSKYVAKINTNPSVIQEYKHFTSEVGTFKCDDGTLINTKFDNLLKVFDSLYASYFNNKSENDWNVKYYDHFYSDYYQKLCKDKDLKWIMCRWKKKDMDWKNFPSWNHQHISNYENLKEDDKKIIEEYIIAVDDIIRQCACPYKLYLLGFSFVLSLGCSSKDGGQDTYRHYDELFHGNPLVITAKGQYIATPGKVTNRMLMKAGTAYFHPSWEWHNTRHGYRNDKGVIYKIMLKYLNPQIINGIWNNIGSNLNHEFLKIDQRRRTFTYKVSVRYGEGNGELTEFRRHIINVNRQKAKKKKKRFTSSKRRRNQKTNQQKISPLNKKRRLK